MWLHLPAASSNKSEGQRESPELATPRYGSVIPADGSGPLAPSPPGWPPSWGPVPGRRASALEPDPCLAGGGRSPVGTVGLLGRAGRGRAGTRPLRPLGATPRSAKLSLGSGRVAAAVGKEARRRRHRVVRCSSPGGRPAPGRPVAHGPRACGSRRGAPLPGSAARASVSGEWGAGRGRALGRAWGGRLAGGLRRAQLFGTASSGPRSTAGTWVRTLLAA